MDVIENYKEAIKLYNQGKPMDCLRLLSSRYNDVKGASLKLAYLQSIVVLVDPIFKLKELLVICDEGMKLAGELKDSTALSYFEMKKAYVLTIKRANALSIKKDITLAPNRINFALESDRDLHQAVTADMDASKQLADELIKKSLEIADLNNHELQAHLHSIMADIYSTECSIYQLEHLRHAKLLHYYSKLGLKFRFVLSREKRKEFSALSKRSVEESLRAANEYQAIDDKAGAAGVYSNIANHLRTIGNFRLAKRYLALSRQVSCAESIVQKREAVAASITDKNKNVPDYKRQLPRPVLRRNTLANLKTKLKDWFANTE